MTVRVAAAFALAVCLLSPCLADTIIFKDGTEKKVRLYKETKEYLSYLFEGKIEVIPREKIKEFKAEGEPITEKELAEALEKSREDMKKSVRQEEKQSGVKPVPATEVKSVEDSKGVKVIEKKNSKTEAKELQIDPFPDHPVTDRKNSQNAGKK